jgi:selenide, water dikinase
VTGAVHPERMVTNAGGRAGDALVLTKPLGGGAIVTARKRGAVDDALLGAAVEVMAGLNAAASEAAVAVGATAMTDVTGFGLLGHLHSLARESGVAAEVDAAAVPAIEGVASLLADEGAVSGGSRRNREYASGFASFGGGVEAWRERLVCDAMTSGGLLVAVEPAVAREVPGVVIGRLVAGSPGAILVA